MEESRLAQHTSSQLQTLDPEHNESEPPQFKTMAEQLAGQKEGVVAWLQAFGAFLIYTATWGLLSAYGSYQSYYESELLASTASEAIAWVGTVDGVLLIMGGILSGPIYDRGYVRELMLLGTFLTVFGVMMTSLSSKYYQVLLAQGFCVGIGSGILFTPSIALVASIFNKHRSLAICFATSGTAIGGVIYPIAFEQLLPRVGFGWATRVLGFITLLELVIALIIILPPLEAVRSSTKKPPNEEHVPGWSLAKVAIKEPVFAAYSLALFFMWIAFWVPFFFIPSFGQHKVGASPSMSFYLLVITNGSTIPGRLMAVFISQRFGICSTLLVFTVISAILLFAWAAIETLAALVAWCVLLGLFIAPLAVLVPAMVPQLCPRKEVVGARMGVAWTAAALGVLLGAPVSSSLNDLESGTFWKSQVLVGTCMAVGAGLLSFVWWELQRQKKAILN